MIIQPLERLAQGAVLDRRLLHVFVAGPGTGEGVLIALPDVGWIAVDGCRARGESCLDRLLQHFQREADPLRLLAFTHPHTDHAAGMPELIERYRPEAIAVTAGLPLRTGLLDLARGLTASVGTTSEALRQDSARAALQAIATWTEDHPEALIDGADGVSRTWGRCTVAVRAPDRTSHLTRVLAELCRGDFRRANEVSLVLEVTFGSTRVVLGSDLPRTAQGARIQAGWDHVLARHEHLGQHALLKVPHHGSAGAQHPRLMTIGTGRSWLLTPFARSRLPRFFDNDGLPALLAREDVLLLTAPTAELEMSAVTDPSALPIGSVRRRALATSDPLFQGTRDITPPQHDTSISPVWGVALDDGGCVRACWRGSSALRITR